MIADIIGDPSLETAANELAEKRRAMSGQRIPLELIQERDRLLEMAAEKLKQSGR